MPSVTEAPWNLDPASGQWTRQRDELRDNGMDLGQAVKVGDRPDIASPERAAQLDAQSRQIIEANAAMTAPVMAARFNEAYRAQGWRAYGEVSPAIQAARLRSDEITASDGLRYERNAQGQTRTPEQAQALAGPGFDDQVMFGRIRRDVPGHIGDGHVLQALAEAKRGGVRDAEGIGGVMMLGDHLRVTGKGEGAPVAQVDVTQPVPKPESSLAAIHSQNQQQAIEQRVAQQQAQQQQSGSLRMA